VENQAESMFWETWLGQTFDFFEQRRMRNMFAEFGIHPDAAFGSAPVPSACSWPSEGIAGDTQYAWSRSAGAP
jgi:hypothetical protein